MVVHTKHIPMTGSAKASLIAVTVLWVLGAAVVGLRFLARVRGAGVGVDDILSLCALILAACTVGFNGSVFVSGVGYDLLQTSPVYLKLVYNLEYILQITFTFTLIYIWTLALLKLSQLYFYKRVFSDRLKIWIYAIGFIVMAWAICFTFIMIFLCDPIKQQWTVNRIGTCMDQILVLKCVILSNLLTDLMIAILPIRTVWSLQMRTTEKIAVLACFALGFACCIISAVRFAIIYQVDLVGNLTGTSETTFMLCSLELMLAILCINIPMLRPFYLQYRARYSSTNQKSKSRTMGESQTRALRSDGGAVGRSQNMTWIELADADNSSQGKEDSIRDTELGYGKRFPTNGIHVSTDWEVTRQ